jgi:glycosyltransferase involved in cell wall biosynthesis
MSECSKSKFRILHCFRAPVGGLFRHVCDLVREQAAAAHEVGIICDSNTGGERAADILDSLTENCALGIHRLPMSRQIGLQDWYAVGQIGRIANTMNVDILHGHGAKGGAYTRLAKIHTQPTAYRFYTPHGGSLHYSNFSPQGLVFLNLERILLSRTDGLIFESEYAQTTYLTKIGGRKCNRRIVYNGVAEVEFESVVPSGQLSDLVFVGEMRALKGVATLLHAIGELKNNGIPVTAFLVGSGPEASDFKELAAELQIADQVEFAGAMPARDAFTRGQLLVVPSHKESLPYIVLEAAAAGMPMIATRVGGIPEIFGSLSAKLIEPQNTNTLAGAIQDYLENPVENTKHAVTLRNLVHEKFSVKKMAADIVEFYCETYSARSSMNHYVKTKLTGEKKSHRMPAVK